MPLPVDALIGIV